MFLPTFLCFRCLSELFCRCFDQPPHSEVLAAQTQETSHFQEFVHLFTVGLCEFFRFFHWLVLWFSGLFSRVSVGADLAQPHIRPLPFASQPPTSFIHVSIRACHSLSVSPSSVHHRFSLKRSGPSPWHSAHHTSTPPSLHCRPFVQSDRTDQRGGAALLFAGLCRCFCSAIDASVHANNNNDNKKPQKRCCTLSGRTRICAYSSSAGCLANQLTGGRWR